MRTLLVSFKAAAFFLFAAYQLALKVSQSSFFSTESIGYIGSLKNPLEKRGIVR
jgi:hypothetical protein